ncbi:MAG TPA: DUF262 domain-containing protein, partial [Candidatus Poseidoniales archaeon]|nr:DUF262 domain-containing protein [Candidatus Poseidoniales archaeon]
MKSSMGSLCSHPLVVSLKQFPIQSAKFTVRDEVFMCGKVTQIMADGFTPTTVSFGSILSWEANRPIVIPKYQREYEWDVDDLEVLLTDFLEHYDVWKEQVPAQQTSYFTGTIVVHQGDNRYVVDGQQRITTITVIL